MLFNSPAFLLVFLPLALLVFFGAAKFKGGRAAHFSLILLSAAFYAWWDWRYLGLLAASTAFNYWLGGVLLKSRSKAGLIAGIAVNVSVLGYFKYTDFAIENLNALLGTHVGLLHIVLPLGISFFTFQKIGYLVDCYKGVVSERDPLRFGLFVMFFPQLIAGPIVHHGQIIPQLKEHEGSPYPTDNNVAQGLLYLIVGLFKKVIIADNIGNVVNPAFANIASLELVEAWTAALGYTLQLYFDFSAYSEMALGIALLFGIRLPINFNSPYKATSITDFWRRWHITLGAFMREYIYIPLGGNRSGMHRMLIASMLTMLIGGLWHGAAWTFVLWGAMHGSMLVLHKYWASFKKPMKTELARILTMVFVIFAWVPFRADSIADTVSIWKKMLGIGGVVLPMGYEHLPIVPTLGLNFHLSTILNGFEILALFVVLYFAMNAPNIHETWAKFEPKKKIAFALISAGMASLFALSKPTTFMYFQF